MKGRYYLETRSNVPLSIVKQHLHSATTTIFTNFLCTIFTYTHLSDFKSSILNNILTHTISVVTPEIVTVLSIYIYPSFVFLYLRSPRVCSDEDMYSLS